MKIIIEKKEWHTNKNGDVFTKTTNHILSNIENEKDCSWIDYGKEIILDEFCLPEGFPIETIPSNDINFSLKIKQIKKDEVILEVSGEAGGEPLEDRFGYSVTEIVLKLNETQGFSTKTKDFGIEYLVSLQNQRDINIEPMESK